MTGKKLDTGKLDYTLLPFEALEKVISVLEFGAIKYGRDNWKHVENSQQRYLAAALRHLAALAQGEQLDKESGKPHLANPDAVYQDKEEWLFVYKLDREKEARVVFRQNGKRPLQLLSYTKVSLGNTEVNYGIPRYKK